MIFGRLSFSQIALVTLVGVAGGVYVYKPIYEQYNKEQRLLKEKKEPQQLGEQKETPNSKSDCGCHH
ncbi:protein PIGBOS1 [Acipenser oxyrinchus oxyrinchus]|uniref:Protein PIGBOS1 n=1 Tax=Acipenser oxyrinchus oxyrinchus TaxID=40147 RepID=A0AAD8D1C0_ACIOX|nr:protein PIGBOS1 [Acipenser oxyrinchus oxyrinchus]